MKTSLGWVLTGPLKGKTLDSNTLSNMNVCVDPRSNCTEEKHETDMKLQKLGTWIRVVLET